MSAGEADAFALARLEGDAARAKLVFRGEPSGEVVEGVSLEQQIELDDAYLLFLTDDCPYEEVLHIYLVDRAGRVLDGVDLGAPYTPGLLEDVRKEGDRAFSFRFAGDERWRVDVHRAPVRTLNVPLLSPVRHRGGLLAQRWLTLARER